MNEPREALVRYYAALRHYGLNDSHSGNASVRDGNRVWITPRGAPADGLAVSDLVACSLPDDRGPGASLDAGLHLAVYRGRAATGAVLHAHSPHTLVLTLRGEPFTAVDHEARHYFPEIPVLTLSGPDYWDQHAREAPGRVAGILARHRVCIIAGHGVYARGDTLDEAYKWLCALEHSARIAWLARE